MRALIGKILLWFIAAVSVPSHDPRYFDDEAAKQK